MQNKSVDKLLEREGHHRIAYLFKVVFLETRIHANQLLEQQRQEQLKLNSN